MSQRSQRPQRKQLATAKKLIERVEHYDLLANLVKLNEEINLGQLLRDDAKEAEAIARKLCPGTTGRKVMAAIERRTVHQAAAIDDSKHLK